MNLLKPGGSVLGRSMKHYKRTNGNRLSLGFDARLGRPDLNPHLPSDGDLGGNRGNAIHSHDHLIRAKKEEMDRARGSRGTP